MVQRVLIVDDDEINAEVLEKILAPHFEIDVVASGEACLERVRSFRPALVLLDIMMPGIDGYETCRRIKTAEEGSVTQVILVSAKASTRERLEGYEVGADDYLAKPFDHDELLAKVRVQLRLRGSLESLAEAHESLRRHTDELEDLVSQRTAEIVATRDVTVFALAKLTESRDPETGEHLERMRSYCQILAEELSRVGPYTEEVDEAFLKELYRSSPLHDIGKVGIPDAILMKPGQLSDSEFALMKRHTTIGADALASAAAHAGSGNFLNMAAEIARYHHERFDGTGYPTGLRGSDIPLAARIVAVADVYDGLTSVRVYKDAIEPHVARSMILQERGRHFDPAIVDAFEARYDEVLTRQIELQSQGDDILGQYQKVLSLTQILDNAELVGSSKR
jgi:putative two-component system response regulator